MTFRNKSLNFRNNAIYDLWTLGTHMKCSACFLSNYMPISSTLDIQYMRICMANWIVYWDCLVVSSIKIAITYHPKDVKRVNWILWFLTSILTGTADRLKYRVPLLYYRTWRFFKSKQVNGVWIQHFKKECDSAFYPLFRSTNAILEIYWLKKWLTLSIATLFVCSLPLCSPWFVFQATFDLLKSISPFLILLFTIFIVRLQKK
jgi:hypothetical protein